MIKKISTFLLLTLTINLVYSKEKVLIVGFPNKNFIAEAKPIDILAKKNSIAEDEVIDLYRNILIENLKGEYNEFNFESGDEKDINFFEQNNYIQLENL